MMNLIAYADGAHDMVALADRTHISLTETNPIIDKLEQAGLLSRIKTVR